MEKKRYSKHSEELKAMIILEYKNTDMGYHLIAKKFGMTRDAVRGIILRNRRKNKDVESRKATNTEIDMDEIKNVSLKNPKIDAKKLDKETREYIKKLEAGYAYFKTYSELLENADKSLKLKKDKKK